MLTRKATAHQGTLPEAGVILATNPALTATGNILAKTMDRRTFLKRSGLVAGGGALATQLPYNMIGSAEAADVAKDKTGVETKRTVCTHCSVGCAVDAVVENGVWIAPGTGVRFAAQSRRPLRQGGIGARAWPWRTSFEVPDETGQRQVPEDQLGAGAQRSQRKIAGDPQGKRPGCDLLGRLLEAEQRTGLPVPQVRLLLRHEQHGPPGAHLPLDHGRRRRQHLGLRGDDQLLQRHAVFQGSVVHRLECRRGASGVACCTCCTPRKTAAR